MKSKVLFIVGPTGVGKTNLAFKLAKKLDGELVSADSIQVFKGLDIISGKDLPANYKSYAGYYTSNSGPSIHLLDVVNPTELFNVADFYEKATTAIDSIIGKGRLPIVVGGSGLYVQVLIKGLDYRPKPSLLLRSQLQKLDLAKLQKLVSKETFEQMNDSDRNNKRRLIQRIEISTNNLPKIVPKSQPKYNSLVIGLACDREILKKRIDSRLYERLQQGAIKEAEELFGIFENLSRQVKDANGYKQIFSYLKKEIDLEEAVERWKISEYRLAKNQMTWFRKYGDVKWYNILDKTFNQNITNDLKKFLE